MIWSHEMVAVPSHLSLLCFCFVLRCRHLFQLFWYHIFILCKWTLCVLLYWCTTVSWLLQTHSAYMLFYERMKVGESAAVADVSPPDTANGSSTICRLDADDDDRHKMKIELTPELAEVFTHTSTVLHWLFPRHSLHSLIVCWRPTRKR